MKAPCPSKILISFIALLLSLPILAQEDAYKLPTREECENCAVKKGANQIEKYGSPQKYLSCLVTGGTSALMFESQNLIKAANKKKAYIEKNDIDEREKYLLLRQMLAYSKLASYSADFALEFPFKDKYYKRALTKYFNERKSEATNLNIWIGSQTRKLNKEFPALKMAMDRATMNVSSKCSETKFNALWRKIDPKSVFLEGDNYRKIIMPCAEVDYNFYTYLDTPKKENKSTSKFLKNKKDISSNKLGHFATFVFMEVICLETDAFYELVDQVVDRMKEKSQGHTQDKWIDDTEAMRMLRISSKTTLAVLRDNGDIRYSQPRKKIILYDRESINQYLENHAKETF